jgi:MoaA/NifB/PqqE/SkfB family radical SAM enzyme
MRNIVRRARSKANHLLAGLSLKTGLNANKPSYVCAKMTMRCNSRCVHCNIWDMDFGEQELSTEEWRRALDGLHDWLGSFNMVFTGGEALLRDDMLEILAYAVSKKIGVELLSNSIVVDAAMARRVVATGIAQITTSFDGMAAATHDRFRGGVGYHAKTVAALEALCAERQTGGGSLRILLKTVISANNQGELVAIARFAREHGLEVLYQPIEQNYGEEPNANWYQESPLWIRDVAGLQGEVAQLQDLKRQGYPIVNTVEDLATVVRYFESPDELMAAVQAHDTKSAGDSCRHAVTNFVISSNGEVRMCFKMEPIGNLKTSAPHEIWNNRQRCWVSPCDHR